MGASVRQRLRYRFDNLMAKGTGAQILLLAAATLVLVAITAVALLAFGVVPADEAGHHDSFGRLLWKALMHALDAGAVGGDPGSWTFLFIMLFVTLGGLFVLSALIGILNNGFGALIEGLRRGRSVVIEDGHTVVLGWSPKVDTLRTELAAAGANQKDACVVIYLKPAADYVALGVDLPDHAVVEAALRRGEVAIGVRRAAAARDASASFGVVVNPPKHRSLRLADGDKVIVLADD